MESTCKLVLGDCRVLLSHNTTYEPPLYLLPELLGEREQSASNKTVWDGVSDAVDVEKSFWHVANTVGLASATKNSASVGMPADVPDNLLSSMIAENCFEMAGISAESLASGKFSSESIIQELNHLLASGSFTEEQKSAVLSNHFINVLAWTKLKEINHPRPTISSAVLQPGQKRQRDEVEQLECPTPWSPDVDNPSIAGKFVSGKETNVESKIQLLENLAQLLQKPIVSLCSRGIQTDYVVPRGTINTTSPYHELRNISYDAQALGCTREGSGRSSFQLDITSVSRPGLSKQVVLNAGCTNIGRDEGIVRGRSLVNVHVGLSDFSDNPQYLSVHHLSLHQKQEELWLLNYGRNGVKINGLLWLLGDAAKLHLPCTLLVEDVKLSISCTNPLDSTMVTVKKECSA